MFTKQKNKASYDLCNKAVAIYAEEMTRVVLVPTWDEVGKYYMGRTKVGVDELSVMATNFSDFVASNEKEIMDNNLVINKMTANSNESQFFASTDSLIDSSYEILKGFEKETIKAGREYSNHKMNQCISVSIYVVSIINELKTLAKVLYIPVITAHQMNRVASAVVDGAVRQGKGDVTKLVGRENVGDAWEIIESSDVAIVLNREEKITPNGKFVLVNPQVFKYEGDITPLKGKYIFDYSGDSESRANDMSIEGYEYYSLYI